MNDAKCLSEPEILISLIALVSVLFLLAAEHIAKSTKVHLPPCYPTILFLLWWMEKIAAGLRNTTNVVIKGQAMSMVQASLVYPDVP